ncbi:MAG TPA: MMPL family transporter [Dehalococcoidia bacterium]|nr:MMPL family transporter [Dehalococcoidia bacterium]
MFAWIGHFVYRHRRAVIVIWIVMLAVGAVFAPGIMSHLKAGGFAETDSEAATGSRILEEELGLSPSSLAIVFYSETLTVDEPRFEQQVNTALADITGIPQIREVITFFNSRNPRMVSADRHTTYASIGMNVDLDEARAIMPEFMSNLHYDNLEQVKMLVTGQPAVYYDIESISTSDLTKAEMYAFPLCLVVLVLAFGTLVAAGLPLVMGGVSLVITIGMLSLLSRVTDMSMYVMNIVSMLGIGIAIDYSLLIVNRFREEIAGNNVEESVINTTSTAGKAVFYSAITTVIGLLGLISFQFMMLRSLGIGGAIVVLVSLMAALTLLPAILAVLGPRINALTIFRGKRRVQSGFWHRLAIRVMKHPVVVLMIVVPFLLALGSPFLDVRFGGSGVTVLPKEAPSRQGFEILEDEFGEGETSPILIAVRTEKSILGTEEIGAIYDYASELSRLDGVVRVDSIVTLDSYLSREQYQGMYANPSLIDNPAIKSTLSRLTSDTTTLISVISNRPPVTQEASALVKEIRNLRPHEAINVYVTGLSAEIMDIVDKMYRDFPKVLIFVLVATYFALLFLFRSVILPLKAILMNVMSILASYGALVFIFQQGHFSNLLDFSPVGSIESSLPIIMFCVLFGLSMDYEVFLLTRIREHHLETGDNTASVALGLEKTGRIITSAALIMVLVAGSFGFTDILLVKAMGIGIAIAILVDSTVVRSLFVPATMRLLGKWNWWMPGSGSGLKGRSHGK